jgi:hypothetical protein
MDVPDDVLGQLGNRVQHALRAFTPRDQKAVRAAAQTFRTNPTLDTEQAITALGVGEALASTLDDDGIPSIVQRIKVAPPGSQLGPISDSQRHQLLATSLVAGVYEAALDRVSAYETLKHMADQAAQAAAATEQAPPPQITPPTQDQRWPQGRSSRPRSVGRSRRSRAQSPMEALASSTMRALGTQIGRQLVRGIMGSLFGGKRRR